MEFFTSDPHWFHTNVIRHAERPFASIDDMHAQMTERWNATVGPDDHVTILGDLSLGRAEEAAALIGDLNGTVGVVPGNHDAPFSRSRDSTGKRTRVLAAWEAAGMTVLPENGRISLVDEHTGTPVEFAYSHFPYVGDSHGWDRYADLRLPDTGLPILHGHVHQEWRAVRNPNPPHSLMINCGVDAWDFAPVPAQTLVDLALGRRDDLLG